MIKIVYAKHIIIINIMYGRKIGYCMGCKPIFSDENNTESLQEFSDARSDIDITEELPHDDVSLNPKTPSPTKEALLPTGSSTPSSTASQEKMNLEVASITSSMQSTSSADLESLKNILLNNNDSLKLFSDYSKNIQLQAQDISNLVENILNFSKMRNESPPLLPTVLSERSVEPEIPTVIEALKKAVLDKQTTPKVEQKVVEHVEDAKPISPVKLEDPKPAIPEKIPEPVLKRQAPKPPEPAKQQEAILKPPVDEPKLTETNVKVAEAFIKPKTTDIVVKPKTHEVVVKPKTPEAKAPELPQKSPIPVAQNQIKSPELPPKPKTPEAAAPELPPKPISPEATKPKTPEQPKTPETVKQKTPEVLVKPNSPVIPVSIVKPPSPVKQNLAPAAPIAKEEAISLTPELKRKAPDPPKPQPVEVKEVPKTEEVKVEAQPAPPPVLRAISPVKNDEENDDSVAEEDSVSEKLNTLKRRPKGKIVTASGSFHFSTK